MRRTVTLVSAALMTVTAVAGCGKKEAANNTRERESFAAAAQDVPKEDGAKLQGTWKVVALEAGGSKAPEDAVKELRVLIAGDRISFSGTPEDLLAYQLDPAARPRTMDICDGDTPDSFEKECGKAIYEMEGDTLKLCFSQATDVDRPKNFNTAGTTYLCYSLQREKP
jgi:uncharacterized protein (TIGR03067 family)